MSREQYEAIQRQLEELSDKIAEIEKRQLEQAGLFFDHARRYHRRQNPDSVEIKAAAFCDD